MTFRSICADADIAISKKKMAGDILFRRKGTITSFVSDNTAQE
jgi:hypothetical protein